jgi:putative hemolysin
MELLENFKKSGGDVAFVVDEYGEVQGMVTFNDVIEAITGEFKPPHAEDAWAIRRDDGSWLLDGLIPTPELKDRLELATVPEEGTRYHTLSGMLQLLMGRLPATGDRVEWAAGRSRWWTWTAGASTRCSRRGCLRSRRPRSRPDKIGASG